MREEYEGNIVDLVDHKYKDKTWSIQIRVDPCALAELAQYFDRTDGSIRTKSKLGAVIVDVLRMVLRDNDKLGENVTDILRAMEIFRELGYQLQSGGRFAKTRIHKTLVVREGFIKRKTRRGIGSTAPLDHVDEEIDEVIKQQMGTPEYSGERISKDEGKTDPEVLAAEREAIDKEQVDEMKRAFAAPAASGSVDAASDQVTEETDNGED